MPRALCAGLSFGGNNPELPEQAPIPAQRILLIRPSALGDVARTVPLIASLRATYPAATIDWLVQDTFVSVVASHPGVSEVLPFPRRDFSAWFRRLRFGRLAGYLRSLRERRYEVVIDAQGLARSGLIAWATRAPIRIGLADAREGAPFAYTHKVRADPESHTVDRMMALLGPLGVRPRLDMRLYAPPADSTWFAERSELSGRRYVLLAPTSRWPAKQWPAQNFAQLATRLTEKGMLVVFVGGSTERDQVQPLIDLATRNPGVLDRMGQTTVGQLMALIEHASIVVANDSAALHIAVGFDRPVVALFGPTRVNRVGPYGREADVLQVLQTGDRFDHKDESNRMMMDRIEVQTVWDRCTAAMAKSREIPIGVRG